MMETHGIAVFDVCGTITKTNNTSDFVGFVLKRDNAWKYGLFVLVRMLCSLSNFPGVRSLLRRDHLRDCQIALLGGYSRARIQEMSELYVNALFARGLFNGRVLDAMKREKEQGRTVFLISAAIDPPIAEMARRLGVEGCFASELEIVDGRCTGRLRTDLLGNKQSVLARVSAGVDWPSSSVYSDNVEDADFMAGFGRRYAVLNAGGARSMWDHRNGRFDFVVARDEPARNNDVNSVTERVAKWTYVPLLYYLISRYRWENLGTPLFRELVPVTLIGWLFTDLGVFSLVLMPLSFLMFYCVYEIGGLVNDLHAGSESPGRATHRISPGVRIHIGLFIAIRAAVVTALLVWLPIRGYPLLAYAGGLGACLAIYLIHTLLPDYPRVLTFTLLKLCRNSVPLLVLAPHVPLATLVWLCVILFAIEAPWRVLAYCYGRGLITGGVSVRQVECVGLAVLWGAGAVIYLVDGSPHLLWIASYYAVAECLWVVRTILSRSV